MRIFKEVLIKEKWSVSTSCDLCKKEARKVTCDVAVDWEAGYSDIDETTLMHRRGELCPSGGSGTVTSCDLCPACFQKHVVEHLESLGVSWRVEERDY